MSFRDDIYALVGQIPAGKLATYGQLAFLCGRPRAARVVGAAMLHAPEGLPCHRVIYRDGTLCCDQAFGGRAVQRKMLEAEGVAFLPDGRADLRAHGWEGPREQN